MVTKTKKKDVKTIIIPPIVKRMITMSIRGQTPLITNRRSEKAKEQIEEKQQQKATKPTKRVKRKPEQEYKDSMYRFSDGGYGFPAIAFKKAAVSACRFATNLPMTQAKMLFHVLPEDGNVLGLVRLNNETSDPVMRTDWVVLKNGNADLRYRAHFANWETHFMVEYDPTFISLEMLFDLFNHAGDKVGVGELRPEKSGDIYGRFELVTGSNK